MTSTVSDLVEFLHARYDEEVQATSARMLRGVEAKRRLLELHAPVQKRATGSAGKTVEDCRTCAHFPAQYPCTTLRLLALPYADHPDYREEWRP